MPGNTSRFDHRLVGLRAMRSTSPSTSILCSEVHSMDFTALSDFNEGNLVGTSGNDGSFESSHSPGKVAIVKTSESGTRLANKNAMILGLRKSCHEIHDACPRAIDGQSVHNSRMSRRT